MYEDTIAELLRDCNEGRFTSQISHEFWFTHYDLDELKADIAALMNDSFAINAGRLPEQLRVIITKYDPRLVFTIDRWRGKYRIWIGYPLAARG